MGVEEHLSSGGYSVVAYVASPAGPGPSPALVLCHGFPSLGLGAAEAARSLPGLADRIAEAGWIVLALTFRGCGGSEGDFSMAGWLEDVHVAAEHLGASADVTGLWLAGFGTGGALAICEGASNPKVRGVAAMAPPADFDDWASNPRRLMIHARDIGAVRDPDFPPSFDAWSRELRDVRAVASVAELSPRPLLLLHGSDDESVPTFDSRVLADEHGGAEIRILDGAGHDLRDDPRAVAILLGWLDRQQRLTS